MKFLNKSVVAAALMGGLAVGTVGMVRNAYSSPTGSSAIRMDGDDYPHLRQAMHDLQAARHSLDDMEPRFRGHRAKAIEHADAAIEEIKICFDEVGAHYDH